VGARSAPDGFVPKGRERLTMPSMYDTLVERARNGDAAALEDLLTRVAPAVRRFGLRMCRRPHDADDVLQDTLLNIATHLESFEGRSSFSSWVFALTRSACSRMQRGLKNRPTVSDDAVPEPHDDAPTPEQNATDRQIGRALVHALDGLPDDYREVILLRDVEGLTAPEAADALGISVDALKSRLHRAREALRNALTPVLEPAAPAARPGCPDVISALSRKIEGDLDQNDCAQMEEHIASCAACKSACDSLKHALVACRRSADAPIAPEVKERVKAAVRAWVATRQAR
jgi:RNA polymerase sigma-70 factor (ECF subfamily)